MPWRHIGLWDVETVVECAATEDIRSHTDMLKITCVSALVMGFLDDFAYFLLDISLWWAKMKLLQQMFFYNGLYYWRIVSKLAWRHLYYRTWGRIEENINKTNSIRGSIHLFHKKYIKKAYTQSREKYLKSLSIIFIFNLKIQNYREFV
jgi:hypothetical protein